MDQFGVCNDLPVDVAVQIASLLSFDDLCSLMLTNRAAYGSMFRAQWLQRVTLVIPGENTSAQKVLDMLGARAITSITSIALMNTNHFKLVSDLFGGHVRKLRVHGESCSGSAYELVAEYALLGQFQKLLSLDLSSSAITCLANVSDLTDLIELDLSFTPVEDLSPLQSLTQLERLDLERTRVKTIEVVRYFPKLRLLNLNATASLRDLTPIKSLTKITTLRINEKNLTEVSSLLAVLPTLTTLDAVNVKYIGISITPPPGQDFLSSLRLLQNLLKP